MQREYNSESFLPEEVKAGKHLKLLEMLFDLDGYANEEGPEVEGGSARFHDIHITTDGYCMIIEWCDHYYDSVTMDIDSFQFVGEDQVVMTEITMPDDSIQLAHSREEGEEMIKEWLKDHPTYKRNDWGRWYDASDVSDYSPEET